MKDLDLFLERIHEEKGKRYRGYDPYVDRFVVLFGYVCLFLLSLFYVSVFLNYATQVSAKICKYVLDNL